VSGDKGEQNVETQAWECCGAFIVAGGNSTVALEFGRSYLPGDGLVFNFP
jgi:hypothetical protein